MSLFGTLRSIGEATGVWSSSVEPIGCNLGKVIYRETRRSARIVNVRRRPKPLARSVQTRLAPEFPRVDLARVRVATHCRLPANRFNVRGSIYAMTFGYTIYWRGDFDPVGSPRDLSRLVHELVHVDQVVRHGGEMAFACAYGKGYVSGGGDVPDRISKPTAYHRNPLEAEAYRIETDFRNEHEA